MNKKKASDTHRGKLDPIKTTILPIANELLTFTKTMPPDLTKWTSLYFKNLYKRLDIKLVRMWLDGKGLSDSARKFETDLNQFLTGFRKWENRLRKARIVNTEQLRGLQNTNEKLFWRLKQKLDEIYNTAEEIANWLKKLAGELAKKAKKEIKPPKTKTIRFDNLTDRENEIIHYYLNGKTQEDIATKLGISQPAVSQAISSARQKNPSLDEELCNRGK
jgi:uncharacterized membrane protein